MVFLYITLGVIFCLTVLLIVGRQLQAQQQLQAQAPAPEVPLAPEAPEPLQAGVYRTPSEDALGEAAPPQASAGGVYQAPAADELPAGAYYGSYESTQDPEQTRFGAFGH